MSSPWWASATCRATCSATACCGHRTSSWSPRSTTATSSSTPIPIRRRRSPSADGCSTLPRSSWADYDTSLISEGGGVFARSTEVDRCHAADARRTRRSTADRAHAQSSSSAPSCGRRSICCGTVASAPTSRRRSRPTREVGDRANDAVRVNANELALPDLGEGGNLGVTQLGRVEYALARWTDLHRCDRQLGGRRLQRPRGQHQDPAG